MPPIYCGNLFVCFLPSEQIFSSLLAITITDNGLKIHLYLAPMAFSSKGSFACQTCYDTKPQFFMSYPQNSWFSMLSAEIQWRSNRYIFWRLRCDMADPARLELMTSGSRGSSHRGQSHQCWVFSPLSVTASMIDTKTQHYSSIDFKNRPLMIMSTIDLKTVD
jgi:hypothetical protein